MSLSPIRYVSFDCYGTLVDFRVADVARDRLADRVSPDRMTAFLEDFTAYRFDEVLGAWKPYPEVLHRSLERTCRRWGVAFDPADAQAIVEAVPTWGPRADVPAALAKVAEVLPLVILSNAADFHRAGDRAGHHLVEARAIGIDQLSLVGMLGLQQAGAFGKGPAGILAAVPFVRADGGEEMLHRRLVAGEQLAVEVAGIPVDQNAAEIEHDSIAGCLRHRWL